MRYGLAVVLAALVLAGCATGAKNILVSVEGADLLGREFISVGSSYNALHTSKQISDAEYKMWADFAKVFKPGYDEAVKSLKAARVANDQVQAKQSSDAIRTLTLRLGEFAGAVFTYIQRGGKSELGIPEEPARGLRLVARRAA